jgi:hypothetical protein
MWAMEARQLGVGNRKVKKTQCERREVTRFGCRARETREQDASGGRYERRG